MHVLFDHVGYEPEARKLLLIEAAADTDWDVIDIVRLPSGQQVLACEPTFVGAVDGWSCGPWWSVDVSELREPGRYAVAWRAGGRSGQSEGFTIGDGVHGDQLVSDIVHYIKGQRCSGIWDGADRAAPRVGDGERRDVHGGWYDASGDYSKYLSHLSYANFMNPQQTPLVVWVLARVWHRLRRVGRRAAAARAHPRRSTARRRLPDADAGSGGFLVRHGVRRLVEGSRAARAVLVPDATRHQGRRLSGGMAAGRRDGGGRAGAGIDAGRRTRSRRRRVPRRRAARVSPPPAARARRTSTTGARTSSTTHAHCWPRPS